MARATLKIICVSSSSRKAGKSSLASFLVRELGADFGLKASSSGTHHTTETVITDPEVVERKGTDTGQLKEAGAKLVIWVNTREDKLEDDLAKALDKVPPAGLLLAEGNSVVAYLDPDFAVFLMSVPFEDFKPSARGALSRSDLVLVDRTGSLSGCDRGLLASALKELAPDARILFFDDEQDRDAAWREAATMARESTK